jgi:hypothetical protein
LVVRTANGGSAARAQHICERRELVHDDSRPEGGGAFDAARRGGPDGAAVAIRPSLFEHKSLYAVKGEVEDEIVDTGQRQDRSPRHGCDNSRTGVDGAPGAYRRRKLQAEHGINCEVIDVRSLVQSILKLSWLR